MTFDREVLPACSVFDIVGLFFIYWIKYSVVEEVGYFLVGR